MNQFADTQGKCLLCVAMMLLSYLIQLISHHTANKSTSETW